MKKSLNLQTVTPTLKVVVQVTIWDKYLSAGQVTEVNCQCFVVFFFVCCQYMLLTSLHTINTGLRTSRSDEQTGFSGALLRCIFILLSLPSPSSSSCGLTLSHDPTLALLLLLLLLRWDGGSGLSRGVFLQTTNRGQQNGGGVWGQNAILILFIFV